MEHSAYPVAGREPNRVGERLAAAREQHGLTVEDVAERTRIPKRHLLAIEAGSAEGLPALTYSAGFVRTYAGLVGLDGDDLARQFRADMGQPVVRAFPEPYEPADPARIPSRALAIVALLLAVAIAGGYAIWRGDGLFGGGSAEREQIAAGTDPALYPPPETAAPSPAPAEPIVAAAPAPAPDGPVAVTATEDAWVKISDSGKTLLLGIMTPGQRFEVPADAIDPVIRTSRAQSLRITIGEAAIPPLAAPDVLVRAASLKRAALLALPATPAPAAPPPTLDYSTEPLR